LLLPVSLCFAHCYTLVVCSNPAIVFGLADARWLVWLPEFLTHEDYVHRYEVLGHWNEFGRVASRCDLCVLLSDHQSLQQHPARADAIPATTPVVVQPRTVADIAHDKRMMATVAAQLPGLSVIPEYSLVEARDWLASHGVPLVIKRTNGTEGGELSVVTNSDDLGRVLGHFGLTRGIVIQPFVSGTEYSVNVVSGPRGHLAFEPVCKGSPTVAGTHPCRRMRHCPCSALADSMRDRLLRASVALAAAIGSNGLLEVEFIVAGDTLWFLELNPRLSATMRMASIACDRSIFAEVPLSRVAPRWTGGVAAAIRHTAELPIAPGTDVRGLRELSATIPVWLSSRVTTAAPGAELLTLQVAQIAGTLGFPRQIAVPDHLIQP
jgi:ATP-grasp domain